MPAGRTCQRGVADGAGEAPGRAGRSRCMTSARDARDRVEDRRDVPGRRLTHLPDGPSGPEPLDCRPRHGTLHDHAGLAPGRPELSIGLAGPLAHHGHSRQAHSPRLRLCARGRAPGRGAAVPGGSASGEIRRTRPDWPRPLSSRGSRASSRQRRTHGRLTAWQPVPPERRWRVAVPWSKPVKRCPSRMPPVRRNTGPGVGVLAETGRARCPPAGHCPAISLIISACSRSVGSVSAAKSFSGPSGPPVEKLSNSWTACSCPCTCAST